MPSYDLTVKVTVPEGKDSFEAKRLLERVISIGEEDILYASAPKDPDKDTVNQSKFEVQ